MARHQKISPFPFVKLYLKNGMCTVRFRIKVMMMMMLVKVVAVHGSDGYANGGGGIFLKEQRSFTAFSPSLPAHIPGTNGCQLTWCVSFPNEG